MLSTHQSWAFFTGSTVKTLVSLTYAKKDQRLDKSDGQNFAGMFPVGSTLFL